MDRPGGSNSPTLFGDWLGLRSALEWTYVAQVARWLAVQPNVQYVIKTGGSGAIPNALVLGAQISVDVLGRRERGRARPRRPSFEQGACGRARPTIVSPRERQRIGFGNDAAARSPICLPIADPTSVELR